MRRGRALVVVVAILGLGLAACVPPAPPHGGPGDGREVFRATGFFHTAYDGHRWWLVTPDGRPFYSTGINNVGASGNDTDRKTGICPYCQAIASNYPSTAAWVDTTVARLHQWGFNTIGTWSDTDTFGPRMPYTYLLHISAGSDWFSPDFATHAAQVAANAVRPRRDDPNLIGWTLDSELRWGPDWRGTTQLLDEYETLPPGSPGRLVADHYAGDPSGFLRALATRYFEVSAHAIHAEDPHHLILGVKQITQLTPPEVLEAARPYVDVFSVDDYTLVPGLNEQIHQSWPMYLPHDPALAGIYAIVHRPLMVMEYSFRAADAGVPNSFPPIYPTYATQQTRTDALTSYLHTLYTTPWFVGDHWFEYVDEPPGGRFDGEDSNFGLVSSADVPWSTLVTRMTALHATEPDRLVDHGPACRSWARVGPDHRVRCVDPPAHHP